MVDVAGQQVLRPILHTGQLQRRSRSNRGQPDIQNAAEEEGVGGVGAFGHVGQIEPAIPIEVRQLHGLGFSHYGHRLREAQPASFEPAQCDQLLIDAQDRQRVARAIAQPGGTDLPHVLEPGIHGRGAQAAARLAREHEELSPARVGHDHVRQTVAVDVRTGRVPLCGVIARGQRMDRDGVQLLILLDHRVDGESPGLPRHQGNRLLAGSHPIRTDAGWPAPGRDIGPSGPECRPGSAGESAEGIPPVPPVTRIRSLRPSPLTSPISTCRRLPEEL